MLGKRLKRQLNDLGDRHAGALGRRNRQAVAATQAEGLGQRLRKGIDFPLQSVHAPGVVECARFLDLFAQLAQPLPILDSGLVIEHGIRRRLRLDVSLPLSCRSRVEHRGAPKLAEVERVELLTGMPEKIVEIDEAARVLEPTQAVLEADGPVLSILAKDGPGAFGAAIGWPLLSPRRHASIAFERRGRAVRLAECGRSRFEKRQLQSARRITSFRQQLPGA